MNIFKKTHNLSIEEVKKNYKTSSNGLSSKEVKKRQKIFGKNILEEKEINYFKIFLKQFSNVLVLVLFIAAIISLLAGKWVDFFAIAIMILINSIIGFWHEVKAEISIKSLKKLTESKNKVIRDGTLISLPSSELVPGDLVMLFEGCVITADIRLIESSSLIVDESLLTGESIPVVKDHSIKLKEDVLEYEQKNMLFTGTSVATGIGKGIVTKTASNTYFASIAKKAKIKSPESPFTKAIKYFAKYYTAFLITIFAAIGLYGYFQGRKLMDIAYILIAELVSAVPEGLPIVVTLVMVLGAVALSRKKTLIRHLLSCETLGSATVIASDKTGTITEGRITVGEVFSLNKKLLELVASLCNESHSGKGDPIDVALSFFFKNSSKLKEKYLRIWSSGFDSKLRIMATACVIENKKKILIKGAFEELKKIAKNKKDLEQIEKKLVEMSKEGLRVLAFGIGDFKEKKIKSFEIDIVGLIGFLDPAKKSVKKAVLAAKKAGIKVMMMTGDYPITAKKIAKDVGIYTKDDLILTGEEVENLKDEDLFKALKNTTVLARILPDHKYRVVKVLQEKKEVVAVSGDGVNDVPALKAADLGIAMGSGTEAAKSVSKMIIVDNNLKIIVDAIRTGRVIADNIRKVIYYLLSSSLQEIFLISFAILAGLPLPLFPIQILWVNLVTDGVQDKAFPFAKEEGNVMQRKPRKPGKQFFDFSQIFRILIFGFVMGIASFKLFKYLLANYSYDISVTITFTSVVMAQWFNGIQSQKEKEPFFKNIKKSFTINPYIYFSIAIGILLQLFAVYGATNLFHTVPIPLRYWKYPIFISILTFLVVEVRKWMEFLFYKLKKKLKKRRG